MDRRSVAVLIVAVGVLRGVGPAGAAVERGRHCYVRVVDQRANGELVTSEPACYPTAAQAREAATAPQPGARAATTFALATHYDGPGFSGGSTTVYGTDCNGGWLNTSAYWAAEMESTANGCPRVRHFHNQNLTGTAFDTTGLGGNLNGTLTHHAWSVQYTT